MKTTLEKFYGLIDQINVAMTTTRRPDGHLESQAERRKNMANIA